MTRGGAIATAKDATAACAETGAIGGTDASATRAIADGIASATDATRANGIATKTRASGLAKATLATETRTRTGRANARLSTVTRATGLANATLAGIAMLVACGGSANPVPAGTQLGPALTAAMQAADQARAPWRCAASDGPMVASQSFKVGDKTWKLEGHVMSREGDGEIVIGAIADAGGSAPPTIAALGRLRDKLSNADVIVALGGMGTTKAELEATLGEIADKVPVVALPGDLEDTGALAAAVAGLRAKGEVVIDGRLVQRIELVRYSRGADGDPGAANGGAVIGLVGGAGAPGRLVAGNEGCAYTPASVAGIVAELGARKSVRILASAEAPRSERAGEPTGELAITVGTTPPAAPSAPPNEPAESPAVAEIDIALHGPMTEGATKGRSGGRDGNAVMLTPGTVDATPRLPDPARSPTAGLLVIRGDNWTWKPIVDAP